jgi:hypothetical protein
MELTANGFVARWAGVKRFDRLQRAAILARLGVALPFPLHSLRPPPCTEWNNFIQSIGSTLVFPINIVHRGCIMIEYAVEKNCTFASGLLGLLLRIASGTTWLQGNR